MIDRLEASHGPPLYIDSEQHYRSGQATGPLYIDSEQHYRSGQATVADRRLARSALASYFPRKSP